MAEVLLLHHAQGLTAGCLAFADELRAAGHVVHAPDLYDGKTFADLDEGLGYAREVGFDTVQERGRRAADGLPDELVYVGFSLGAMPAQLLAQTRPGAKGAVLLHASIPPAEFGGEWPPGVPLQIHTMEDDELGDVDVTRARGDGRRGAGLPVSRRSPPLHRQQPPRVRRGGGVAGAPARPRVPRRDRLAGARLVRQLQT
jgi:dienelactone hydrolase